MKFGQQLNESAVPEWRIKYLDYKAGKKKLKAVAKAIRKADNSPRQYQAPFSDGPFKDAPIRDLFHRDQQEGQQDKSSVDGRQDPERTPRARAQTRPIAINERSPLRGGDSTQDDRPGLQGMVRYGSIIGSPADSDGGMPNLEQVRSAGQASRTSNGPASTLELPAPAMGPRLSPHPSHDGSGSHAVSPGSPEHLAMQPPQTHRDSLSDPSSAQDFAAALPPRNNRSGFFATRRSNSDTRLPPKKPLIKRILSVADANLSPNAGRQPDIALEAYRELDLRQTEFFMFLDKELDKIETFYKSKEDAADERLRMLREQLHIMRNRRLEDVQAAQHYKQSRLSANVADDDATNGDSSGIMPLPKTGGTAAAAGRRISSAVERIDQTLDKVRTGHIGKTSKVMGQLGSPVMRAVDASKQDYTRRPASGDVPYRVAKRKLKIALAEYYRGLELLKSYAMTNRTAFRKILKKYDKTVNYARPNNRFMAEKVNTAWFVNSDVVENHIHAVEDLYARYFERGSRKIAVNKLRAKVARADDYTGSIWRQGVMATAGLVFGIEGLTYGAELLFDQRPEIHLKTSYLLQIYAGYFLMLSLVALFVLDCRIFSRAHVNYQFIFEFDARHTLDWRQLSEMPALFCLLLGLTMWLNFNRFGGEAMYVYWPVVLAGVSVLLFLAPLPILYPRGRVWFLHSNGRLLLPGYFAVEFRDFFLGDMYCSQTYALGNIEMFFCLYARDWRNPPMCNSSHSRLFGFFQCIPGIVRALQCLRRYKDTRNVFPHLVNMGKYTFTILSYVSLSLYRTSHTSALLGFFIFCSIINSIYCSFWDVYMDWSLGDPWAKHRFLRKHLAYKNHWWYYIAMFIDPILRSNWIFYVIYRHDVQHSTLVSFFIAFSEVLRRGMWTIFRVENEHCSNVGHFRASRDVALPYPLPSTEQTDSRPTSSSQRTSEDTDDAHSPHDKRAKPLDHRAGREEEEEGGQADPSPTISGHTSRTTGTDLEGGRRHAASSDTSAASLRLRRKSSAAVADSPVSRALHRVGSTIAAAHSQDYERKKKPESTREEEEAEAAARESGDDDDDESSDEEMR